MRRLLWSRCAGQLLVTLTIAMLLGTGLAGLACETDDSLAGSKGVGDPYLPAAGNGGYQVLHYDISLNVDPVSGVIEGRTTIEGQTTQTLESFHLDLAGLEVGSVKVDGRGAEYRRDGQELIVTCPESLQSGEEFSAEVVYSGRPEPVVDAESYTLGWQKSDNFIYTLDEPLGAATWFPVNDHPSDKATYVFRLTVPKPYLAAANGALVETRVQGKDQTFVWEMRQPLASYLAAVSIGEYVVEESTAPNGVPIRNYFAPAMAERAETAFAGTGEVLTYFAELFGPYPFEAYGVVVLPADTGVAMENQTLSLFGSDVIERFSSGAIVRDIFLSHELAHQWFGNSVTITRWQDVWLNEGFATYASWLWLEHDTGPAALTMMVKDSVNILSGKDYPPLGDPGIDGLFSANVYRRGALTLHALRLAVGDDAFFKILREWATRYRFGNVTTEDFMSLVRDEASNVPAAELAELFDAWLYEDDLPALPETGL
jgi:aminopeptidase N